MKYNKKIQKYYENDINIGSLDEADLDVGSAIVGAPACGDVMKLQIKVEKINTINGSEKFIIKDAKIKVFGCGSAKASSTLAVEMLIGKDIEEAKKITNKQIKEELGLPAIKFHCSVLAEEAIKQALENFENKNNIKTPKNIQSITKTIQKEDCRINENSCEIENLQENKNTSKSTNNFDFNLQISQEAENYLNNFLSKQEKSYIGLRIDLVSSNCGLSYKIKGIKDASEIKDDIIFKTEKINFFIERKIAHIINNTQMEFKKDGLKSGIFFVNPKEVGKCGCGMNFKLEDTQTDESNCGK